MQEQHVFDLIPGYTLGILDETEIKEVEDHLRACQRCQEELEGYKIVLDGLPLAVKTSQPPTHLKAGIMERVREDRQAADKPDHISTWDRFRRALVGSAPAWGAVSLVLVLILVVSNLLLWQRVNHLRAGQQELITVDLHGTDVTPEAFDRAHVTLTDTRSRGLRGPSLRMPQ